MSQWSVVSGPLSVVCAVLCFVLGALYLVLGALYFDLLLVRNSVRVKSTIDYTSKYKAQSTKYKTRTTDH